MTGAKLESASLLLFEGGGETGELMKSMDWGNTALGSVEEWPQSLKTCVRIILTSRQPMFVWWGKELINLYNDPYKAIVGGKHPWALGKPASEVWSDIWDEAGPRAQICLQENTGTYDEALLLIMERNGYPEETYYTFSYSPVPGEDGRPAGIICANTDDTDRIIGERQLRTLKDLGKYILDCASNEEAYQKTIHILKQNPHDFPFAAIYEIKDEKIAKLQDATENRLKPLLPDEIDIHSQQGIASLFRQVIDEGKLNVFKNAQEVIGQVTGSAWTKAPSNCLVIPLMQSGHSFPFALMVIGLNPFRQPDEKYLDFFRLVADQVATCISTLYAYDQERKRAEALAEIDKAKTLFFSNISHEFRTPLTLMLGPLESMLGNAADLHDDHIANIESTHRNAMRLLRLVNTLLDFSRIEADRVQARFSPVNLSQLTTDISSAFRSVIENVGLEYKVSVRDLSSNVYVDREMWEKIVLNLLSNAFKYTLSGKIEIQLEEKNGNVLLSVSDTGIGIPEKELPQLFNRFYRVKNAGGRTYEGTGIGLSLVKELVELHNGTIDVESKEGVGSVFSVCIAAGKDHLPADQIQERNDEVFTASLSNIYVNEAISLTGDKQGKDAVATEKINGKKYRVLVVDDNSDMRDYVGRLLNKEYEVVTAENGKDALGKIYHQRPDLILSDIMMPVMDGIELLHAVKGSPSTDTIPVIFISARAGEEARIEGYNIGADDYLVKPFSSKELLARVRSQLKIANMHKEVNDALENKVNERTKELQKASEKLEQINTELRRTNKELEQFAFVSSHDLQEPLRKIQTFADLINRNIEQPAFDVKRYLEKINASAERMSILIKDLLNFSKLSKINEEFVQTDLNKILQDVISDFEVLIKQKNAEIKFTSLPIIKAIPLQMNQLFYNLISNGLKFSNRERPVIEIKCAVEEGKNIVNGKCDLAKDQSYLHLSFKDNGIGFDQSYADQIFTIFQRLNNDKQRFSGTGIGLAICKKIVENHRGCIAAHGAENAGATFDIYLPVAND
ncbi:ATP-binding protein [Pinibacter aurantiacus]|uniref:histidine kinase n=1 Tax=Pinibacter aurantiacus TaxID=2851599 RepID=A0A9E2W3C6_9BACT|nr:ATP-binding protein [Pinibacter aurantiacus]MBV4356103.1 response regulator [Pinibacter aurantiacus]